MNGEKKKTNKYMGFPVPQKIRNIAEEILHWLEIGLAVCTVFIVIVGAHNLFKLWFYQEPYHDLKDFSTNFESILSAILLLVVAVELAIMLVMRRPESLIEIMFFVIARKVLIKTEHVYDLLIAVAALGALFAVEKYLMAEKRKLSRGPVAKG